MILFMDVKIITLSTDKWEAYKELRLRALKNNPEAFGQPHEKALLRSDDEWKMLLEKSAYGQKRWLLFAKVSGELVGMVSGTSMKSVEGGVKIQEMYVDSKARGEGIATKLMQALSVELLKNTDRRILRLGVFDTQTVAVSLYKSLGFKVIEAKTEHFPGGYSHESLIMEKNLK